ncbi:MAG TPA: hypothetical protein VJM11_10655 [Nevskiaceae bacterium]|nr:hypothetical protein [Nevskiaceae bacterium]
MYDPAATLAMIDRHVVAVMGLCVVALVFNYVYFGEALRLGFRHRTYSVPATVTLLFLPHDLSYVAQWHKWFVEIDHWFCKLWWLGLVLTASIEGVFFYQLLRYGREEILPMLTQAQYVAAMFVALAVAAIAWLTVKQAIDDELYLFSFGWTLFWGAPLCVSMMVRRGSSRGQSRLMWISYMLMALFYWAAVSFVDPYFRSPGWLAILGLALGCAAANLWMLSKVPAWSPRAATSS